MKEIGIEEVKKIQLEILTEVSEFCEQNNIKYFLCAGTLLGAIRHKGFIPWDDDIDIMMPRPDYERFVKEYKSNRTSIFDSRKVKGYYYPFVKVANNHTVLHENFVSKVTYGVNIDVFPLDGMPSEKKLFQKQIKKVHTRKLILNWKELKLKKDWVWYKKMLYPFIKIGVKLIPTTFTANDIIEIARQYEINESEKAGIVVWGYGEREICPQSVFNKSIDVEFEGQMFKAPKEYNVYLSTVYGAYMELPPKEEQIRRHSFKVYSKSK